MKTLNLTIAIIYTVIYGIMLLSALWDKDSELLLGTIVLSGPVITNWITYKSFK